MPKQAIPAQSDHGRAVYAAPAHAPSGRPLPRLEIEVRPVDDRQLVSVTGEVDIDADLLLHSTLCAALERARDGVDLDLSAVDFFDCSGLNVLLRVRQRALASGKTLRVHAVSGAVHRLLTVTGTLSVLAPPTGPDTTAPGADASGATLASPGSAPDTV